MKPTRIHHKHQAGQAILIIAFAMVGLLATLGLAIDGGGMFLLYRDVQNATDAGALSAAFALCTGGDPDEAARDSIALNGFVDGVDGATVTVENPPSSGTYAGNLQYVRVSISADKPAYFIQIVYGGPLNVSANTTSECDPGGVVRDVLNSALVTLRPDCPGSHPSLDIGGTAQVTIIGDIFVNQDDNSCFSIDARGAQTTRIDGSVCTLGNIDYDGSNSLLGDMDGNPNPEIYADMLQAFNGSQTDTPDCTADQITTTDPYGFGAPNHETICGPMPGSLSTIGNGNYSPGHYAAIDIKPSHTTTLQPGNYCIAGDITMKGTVDGSGVFFYQYNTSATFETTSQADINLTAGSSGDYQGFLLYSVSQVLNPFGFKYTAGSAFNVNGSIYIPQGHCVGRGTSGSILFGQLLCWTMDVAGTSDTVIFWDPGTVNVQPPQFGITE